MDLEDLMIENLLRNIFNPLQQFLEEEFNRIDLPLDNDVIDEITVFLPFLAGLVHLDDIPNLL